MFYCENRNSHHLAFVGRLDEVKNVDYIINAVAMLPDDWKLSIVGSGPLGKRLYQLAQKKSVLNRIEFYGWLDNPWEVLGDVGYLVLASDYEGFNLTVIEALACGIGVISPPVGTTEEVIIQGINGYIYDKNKEDALFEILIDKSFDTCNPDICRNSVMQYDISSVGAEFLKVLEEIVYGWGIVEQ